LETLLTKAKDRLEMSMKVELWSIDDEGFVLAIASNLLFSCIIMSNSVKTKLLENPTQGEIILADELLRIRDESRIFAFVWDFIHYSIFSAATMAFQIDLLLFLIPIGSTLLQATVILLSLGMFIMPIHSRIKTPSQSIESVYDTSRQDAEYEVFGELDRGVFSLFIGGRKRTRIDESTEFRLGMLPGPLLISVICGTISFIIFTTILSVISEWIPFLVLPLSLLFASMGFAFTFELANPMKSIYSEHLADFTDSLFNDEQTRLLEKMIHELPGYTEFCVRKRKVQPNRIFLKIDHEDEIGLKSATISDTVVKTLENPEDLLVYTVAELKRNMASRRENRIAGYLLGIITLLFFCIFLLHTTFPEVMILIIFLYLAFLFGFIVLLMGRIRRSLRKIDVEVQRIHPSFYKILENLQNRGNPFEVKQHKERFEYLQKCHQINLRITTRIEDREFQSD
jgi:mRNA-degrading endonuclease RelE of RelBE toxin-antitoxin system